MRFAHREETKDVLRNIRLSNQDAIKRFPTFTNYDEVASTFPTEPQMALRASRFSYSSKLNVKAVPSVVR